MFAHSESGYMDGELFQSWLFKIFIPNCGRERPVVLILDNHDSHVTLPLVETAKENNVVIVGLPGHTTHFLQPLDVKVHVHTVLSVSYALIVDYWEECT
ncbi:MAG: hypothetical protein ABW185_05060 [Sedimenticola sp.]